MTEKTIQLSRRYAIGSETFDSVTIREPRFADLMKLGEPYEMQRAAAGMPVVYENTETIEAYAMRCVQRPAYAALLELGIADARKVREGLLSFFSRGDTGTPKRSGGEPTNSSSSAGGMQVTLLE